eukprot:s5246_g5.t1
MTVNKHIVDDSVVNLAAKCVLRSAMTSLAEVWAELPGIAARGATGRLIIGPVNLQRPDLDFNWNIVGHAILWVGVRPSVDPLADSVGDFFHLTRLKGAKPVLEEAGGFEEGEEEHATDDEAIDVEAEQLLTGVDAAANSETTSTGQTVEKPSVVVQLDTAAGAVEGSAPLPGAVVVAAATAEPAMPKLSVPLRAQRTPPDAIQRMSTSDSVTTAASTIATPPPNRPGSPPSSTEKLPLPASQKRAILLALENECANIEMLLKAKGDLAAKKAFENARSRQLQPGMDVDRVDTYPMDEAVAEDVLQAARVEVHQRELLQSMEEVQPEAELSEELRGTTLVLGQEATIEDDARTIYFEPEGMIPPDGTGQSDHGLPDNEKLLELSDDSGKPDDEKLLELSDGTGKPDDEKLLELSDGAGKPHDEKPIELSDGAGKPDDEKPIEAYM